MKKLFSILVLMGILCSLTAFTVGCGDAPKKSPTPTPTPTPKSTPT